MNWGDYMKIPTIDPIFLSHQEFQDIMKQPIGHGSEGVVYQVSPYLLFKIYYGELYSLQQEYSFLSDDVKVVEELSSIPFQKQKEKTFYCLNEEGIRLRNEYAVMEAKRRQKDISLTPLPLAPVFIDHRFRGIAIYYFSHAISIYQLKGLSPKNRRKILWNLFLQCDELVNHFVYPTDFTHDYITKLNRGNVLVDVWLQPHIIDLDGNSAFYCSSFQSNYYLSYLYSLNSLFCDFWLDMSFLDMDLNDIDLEFYEERLKEQGIPSSMAPSLVRGECTTNDLRRILVQ